jgi:hypothetical protein
MPGSLKALRLLNLLVGGGLSASQLETELAVVANKGAFVAAMRQKAFAASLADSSAAITACLGSATASAVILNNTIMLQAIANSTTAMTAYLANSAFMTSVAASSFALALIMGNTIARSAIYNSDAALAILANSTTRDIARALTNYTTKSIANGSSTSAVSLALTGSAILFEYALDSTGTITLTGRRSGSTQGTIAATDPTATALPGDVNVVALTNAATVATSSSAARTSYFGLIYV